MRLLGAVLAGGFSRRMGSDKALLEVDHEALWRRQARALKGAGAERIVLVRRPGQAPPWEGPLSPGGINLRRDVFARAGPLAGLHAALTAGRMPWVAVLGVDMPGIDASWFRWLLGFCSPGAGAIIRHAEAFEPLAAIYPREALPEILARLTRRDLSLQRLARVLAARGQMRVLSIAALDAPRIQSWNHPA